MVCRLMCFFATSWDGAAGRHDDGDDDDDDDQWKAEFSSFDNFMTTPLMRHSGALTGWVATHRHFFRFRLTSCKLGSKQSTAKQTLGLLDSESVKTSPSDAPLQPKHPTPSSHIHW